MSEPINAILFGAGARGADAYGPYALAHPDEIRFIAVAEPNQTRRDRFAKLHKISDEFCFESWEHALSKPKFADVVINCTQDQMHFDSGMAGLQAGYHMLLEKPICHTLENTITLVKTAENLGRLFQVCHVMRYTNFGQTLHEIVTSGRLGQPITISHRENVAAYHMAHSYVRGNWRRQEDASPMILAKCCHDLDLLYWLLAEPVTLLSSTGNLRHFRPENAPIEAPQRCTDGCPIATTCPFEAKGIYLDLLPFKAALSYSQNRLLRIAGKLSLSHPELTKKLGKFIPKLRPLTEYQGWPRSVITDLPESDAAVLKALQEGPYGRCVYHCDNDVVDHQVVNMVFESGANVTLTMNGHSHVEGRTIRIDGSDATLLGKQTFSEGYIEIWNHLGLLVEKMRFKTELEGTSGHGGGDFGLMKAFIKSLHGEQEALTNGRASLESHLLAFAAEKSRLNNTVIHMQEFRLNAQNMVK